MTNLPLFVNIFPLLTSIIQNTTISKTITKLKAPPRISARDDDDGGEVPGPPSARDDDGGGGVRGPPSAREVDDDGGVPGPPSARDDDDADGGVPGPIVIFIIG